MMCHNTTTFIIRILYHTSSIHILFKFSCSSQVPVEPQIAKHASLYHQVALLLLPRLLPGAEHLAHELLATVVFSRDFIA